MLSIKFLLFCAAVFISLPGIENLENAKNVLGSVSSDLIKFPAKLNKFERISIPLTNFFIFDLLLKRSGVVEFHPDPVETKEHKIYKVSSTNANNPIFALFNFKLSFERARRLKNR